MVTCCDNFEAELCCCWQRLSNRVAANSRSSRRRAIMATALTHSCHVVEAIVHLDITCDGCEVEPIAGSRCESSACVGSSQQQTLAHSARARPLHVQYHFDCELRFQGDKSLARTGATLRKWRERVKSCRICADGLLVSDTHVDCTARIRITFLRAPFALLCFTVRLSFQRSQASMHSTALARAD